MTDPTMGTFEARLGARLLAYADVEVRPVDELAVARRVTTTGHRRWAMPTLRARWFGRPAVAMVLVIALLAALLAVVASGSWPRLPSIVAPTATTSSTDTPSPTPAASSTPVPFVGRTPEAAIQLLDGRVLVFGAGGGVFDPVTSTYGFISGQPSRGPNPGLALLHDGRVLVIGDWDASANPTAAAQIYDPSTGLTSTTGSMARPRLACNCGIGYLDLTNPSVTVLDDGRVLVAGGVQGPPTSTDPYSADLYDPAVGAFTSIPVGCDATRGAQAKLRDGRVLVTCLAGQDVASNHARLFDPSTNTFSDTGSPGTTNSGSATLLPDGRVLLTGEGLQYGASRAEIYDPASNQFTTLSTKATNPNPNDLVLVAPDGRILFLAQGGGPSYLFNPALEAFNDIAMPAIDARTAVLLKDGRILLVGGSSNRGLIDRTWLP